MKFKRFSELLQQIEETSSRIDMTNILATMFKEANSEEVAIMCYLINGRVAPDFIPAEFNLADKSILSSLQSFAAATGKKIDVKGKYDSLGDLGLVAEEILGRNNKNKYKQNSVKDIYENLWKIVGVSGSGAVERKSEGIMNMLSEVSPLEGKYVVRILNQTLRIGSSRKTIMDALSVAKTGEKDDRDDIQRAFGVCSDMGYVAQRYMSGDDVSKIEITPGTPIAAMLVERVKEPKNIIERLKDPIVQPKYDGLRCQIHVGVDEEKKL